MEESKTVHTAFDVTINNQDLSTDSGNKGKLKNNFKNFNNAKCKQGRKLEDQILDLPKIPKFRKVSSNIWAKFHHSVNSTGL